MEMDRKRSLVKTISWRALATTDTFIIAYVVTFFVLEEPQVGIAASIASIEVVTKLFLYYLHERGWAKVTWGVRPRRTPEQKAADLHAEADALLGVGDASQDGPEATAAETS